MLILCSPRVVQSFTLREIIARACYNLYKMYFTNIIYECATICNINATSCLHRRASQ